MSFLSRLKPVPPAPPVDPPLGQMLTRDMEHPLLPAHPPVSQVDPALTTHWPYEKVSGEPDFAKWKAEDPWPIPADEDREFYYAGDDMAFWCAGLHDYLMMTRLMEKYGRPLQSGNRVFDFGCATGRVLRHFAAHAPGVETLGSDIARNYIRWVQTYLPPRVHIFRNSILPHLPLADNSLDLAYGFSIFTHIDDFEDGWLLEFNRIVKPGGFAMFTIQTEDTWHSLHDEHYLFTHLAENDAKNRDTGDLVTAEMFKKHMPSPRVILRRAGDKTYDDFTFHTKEYIHQYWGRCFKVHEIIFEAHSFQDLVVMQKL